MTTTRHEVLDTSVTVAVTDPDARTLLTELLAPFPAAVTPGPPDLELTGGETPRLRVAGGDTVTGDLPRLIGRLLQEFNRLAIERTGWFSVHAGVVARSGRTVAFPAPSGGGKSTLTAAAVAAGWAYGSDEALVLDDDLRVVPYPRPLGLSAASRRLLEVPSRPPFHHDGEAPTDPAALGDGGLVEPGRRLTDVVVLRYCPCCHTEIEEIPPSDVAAALLRHSFNHYRDPLRAYRLTAAIAAEVRGWRLSFPDAREALAGLEATLW